MGLKTDMLAEWENKDTDSNIQTHTKLRNFNISIYRNMGLKTENM